jgi:hypothetical protein
MRSIQKSPTTQASLTTLKIGSRVRCSDDGVTGRIVWANAVAVKIRWDDGEQVTWRRDSLADRPIQILAHSDSQGPATSPAESTDSKQTDRNELAQTELEAAYVPSEPTAMASPSPALEVAVAGVAELVSETSVAETNPWSEPGPASDQPKRQPKASEGTRDQRLSALDAAAKVLSETGQAMTCQELIAAMAAKGYWSSPKGRTPASTLYAAVLRELQTKDADSRFIKTERGKFALRSTT